MTDIININVWCLSLWTNAFKIVHYDHHQQCTQYTKNNGGYYMRAASGLLNKGLITLTFVKFSFITLKYSGNINNFEKKMPLPNAPGMQI